MLATHQLFGSHTFLSHFVLIYYRSIQTSNATQEKKMHDKI